MRVLVVIGFLCGCPRARPATPDGGVPEGCEGKFIVNRQSYQAMDITQLRSCLSFAAVVVGASGEAAVVQPPGVAPFEVVLPAEDVRPLRVGEEIGLTCLFGESRAPACRVLPWKVVDY